MPVEPRPGENEAAFMERCIETETEAGFGQEQAVAICATAWAERDQRNDAVPPQGVQEAAQQGLDYRSEYGRGGTDVGIARARDLVNGENIPPETLARMRSFFARHEENRVPPTEKTEPDGGPTNGWIAWLLWGGDAGQRWAESQRAEDSMVADTSTKRADLEAGNNTAAFVYETPVDATQEQLNEIVNQVKNTTGKDITIQAEGNLVMFGGTDVLVEHVVLDVAEAYTKKIVGENLAGKKSTLKSVSNENHSVQPCFVLSETFGEDTIQEIIRLYELVTGISGIGWFGETRFYIDTDMNEIDHASLDVAELLVRRTIEEKGITVGVHGFKSLPRRTETRNDDGQNMNQPKSKRDSRAKAVKGGALRVDFADQPIRMTMTDEGYLTGQARVARVGIQSYQDGEGGVRREFRPVGEVFSADAISSFKNMPVTMGHPQEGLVTADNAKRLSVGHVGENIRPDGEWLVMPITITDAETIEQIANGVVELSGGYMADLDELAGEYDGEVYDAVQRNIRGNHVAVVQQARAGEMARLNLDAAGAVQIIPEKQTRVDDMSDKSVTVRVDGIEYEVSPEVERHMTRVDEQVTALTAERDQAKADAETSKAKADEAAAEVEKLRETHSDEAIREAAKARVALERTASKILGDEADLDGMSERDLQEAVVKAVHADADLTEASDVYVQARFDAAVETHKAHADASTKQRETAAPKADAKMKDPRDSAVSDIRDMYKNRNGMTKRQNSK